MRAFVLGAGASLHAGYPSAKNLGSALVGWAAQNLPPQSPITGLQADHLKELFPSLDDFEEIVSELQEPTRADIVQLPDWKRASILSGIREALSRYFDVLRVNDAPLYCQFAQAVLSPGDTIITFNYDVSLEAELRKVQKWHVGDGYGFLLGSNVTAPSPVRLLKLHGSTSWIDILFGGARGGDWGYVGPDGPVGARPLILPEDFEFFGYPQEIRDPSYKGGGSSRSGSMILPARRKFFGERPQFWDHLWSQAEHALCKADEIVVIGYSLPPVDERARDLLLRKANKNASISICCGSAGPRIVGEFTQEGFVSIESSAAYFADWLACQQPDALPYSGQGVARP